MITLTCDKCGISCHGEQETLAEIGWRAVFKTNKTAVALCPKHAEQLISKKLKASARKRRSA